MFFKCRIGEKTYELEKLTLGDARTLKREFGLSDLEFFSATDPDQLTGLLYLCERRANPGADHDVILARVEALDIEDFVDETETPEADPTPAATPARGAKAKAKTGA